MAQTATRPLIDYAPPVRAGVHPSWKKRLKAGWALTVTALRWLMKGAFLLATGVLFFQLTRNNAVPWIVLLLGVLAIVALHVRGLLPVILRLVATLLRVTNVLWLIGTGGMLAYLAIRHAVDPGGGLALQPGPVLMVVIVSVLLEGTRWGILKVLKRRWKSAGKECQTEVEGNKVPYDVLNSESYTWPCYDWVVGNRWYRIKTHD